MSGVADRTRALRGERAKRAQAWPKYLTSDEGDMVFELLAKASTGEAYDWTRLSDDELTQLHVAMDAARSRAEVGGPTPREIEDLERERMIEKKAREWAEQAAARAAAEAQPEPQKGKRRRLRTAPEPVLGDTPTPLATPTRLLPSNGGSGYVSPRAWRSKR